MSAEIETAIQTALAEPGQIKGQGPSSGLSHNASNSIQNVKWCRDWVSAEERAAWYWTLSREAANDPEASLAYMLNRWRVDPVMFAAEALRINLQPYQAQILLDLADAPLDLYAFYQLDETKPKRQLLVPSGHGLGKTRVLAVAIWWHLLTHQFSKTICTAPTSDQLSGQLWGELRKLRRRMKKRWPKLISRWQVLTSQISHDDPEYGDWYVMARTARPEKTEGLQGAHALDDDDAFGQLAEIFGEEEEITASGGILIVVEEASGVDDKIREVFEGSLSEAGARMLAVGNPTRPDGWFADDLEKTDRYAVHHLDCRMSNRDEVYSLPYRYFDGTVHHLKIKGFVEPRYWEDILKDCDGDEDADRVRVRVRGMTPRSAFEQCIRTNWVEEAVSRGPWGKSTNDEAIIGLDFGLWSDKHGLAVRQGWNVRDVQEWLPKDKPDEVTLDAYDRAIDALHLYKAKIIIGDSNGVGRGAMEALSRYVRDEENIKKYPWLKKVRIVHFNSGEGALDKKRFYRRRDEMWYKKGRAFFSDPRCSIPDVPGLKRQLTTPGYHEDATRRIQIETKKEMFKRTGEKSGNGADALLHTLMVEVIVDMPKEEKEPEHPPVFMEHFKRFLAKQEANSSMYIR